jgi:TRAP-type C4-dicarboxylate transport system substrate-binding protein
MTDYAGTYVYKTGEHLKYATENASTAYTAVFVVAMNKKKFESLPPDVQKIVERLSESYIEKWGKIWTDDTAMGKEWLQKRGVEFIKLSKEENDRWFEQGARPLLESYIKDMKAQGMPGKEAVDFLLDTIKKYKK